MPQQNVPPDVPEVAEPIDACPGAVYPPPDGATMYPLFAGLPSGAGAVQRGALLMPDSETNRNKAARIRATMPLYRHRRYLCRSNRTGELFYFEIAWLTVRRWRDSAWAASGAWRSLRLGPFVVAWTFTF